MLASCEIVLVRSSYIETQYYSSVLVHFPSVCCYYCGLNEESLEDNKLENSYAIVNPICFL